MIRISIEREMRRARASEREGRIDDARGIYAAILRSFPQNARARSALAALDAPPAPALSKPELDRLFALYNDGDFARVAEEGEVLAARFPTAFPLWMLLGSAERALGRFQRAERAFRKAVALRPDAVDAHRFLGRTQRDLGRLDEAIASFGETLRLEPDDIELLNLQGVTLKDRNRPGEALVCLDRAIALAPGNALLHSNRGLALKGAGRLDEAVAAYRHALELDPSLLAALGNLGSALKDQGAIEDAIETYRRALAIAPGNGEVLNNLGAALKDLGQPGEAIDCFRQALLATDHDARIHYNLGGALKDAGQAAEAALAFDEALRNRPDYGLALAQRLRHKLQLCDWSAFAEFDPLRRTLGTGGDAVDPFALLAIEDHPERQALRAATYARRTFPQRAAPLSARLKQRPERLRVGYFSADFREHATLHLMSGLLREHDRSRFEIFAFGYAPPGHSPLREQAERDVDHFIDIHAVGDRTALAMAHRHGIDIAVDCMGYTQHSRSRLFAARLAPVQIGYLGYPGTMGADFIDHIIADPIVLPPADQRFYAEKVLYLPHSYQPNDNRRTIAETDDSRASHGLPEQGFVFTCFNQNYKIGPREFDIWMRALSRVEGSVLWLLDAGETAAANLRREARARGVDPQRLVFAPRMPHDLHLARHRHGDLFLDTFAYNAHTTGSDALWAGLPVVTRLGRQFSARVGASLLTAVGLPELVTTSETAYEALILDLATDPVRLQAVRAKLDCNRRSQPLFDTVRYTRDFEAALDAAYAGLLEAVSL